MSNCDCDYSTTTTTVTAPSGINDPSGWCACVITAMRAHVGDLDSTQFTDARILEIYNVASFMVHADLACCSFVTKPNFSICHNACETTNPFTYPSFTALALLKGACLVDQGAARSAARRQGLTAACGSARLSVSSGSSSYQVLFENGPCMAYKKLKDELCFECPMKSASHCAQILSSFASWTLNHNCGHCTRGCRGHCTC